MGPQRATLAALRGRLGAKLEQPAPYWLTRFVFLRALGFIYFVAFLSLAHQLLPLIGSEGLLPAELYLNLVERKVEGHFAGFLARPTLFWLYISDGFMLATCWVGVGLSLVVLLGYANALLMALLWFLYMSFVHIGQTWYSFGWEIQLLETGVLGILLCPLLDGRPFPRTPPPRVIIWLLRWLTFRIMLGAGLIKLRGDACWRELTCLVYHYETQPVPHPLSWLLHSMPVWFHKLSVAFNHFVELFVPFFAFGPRRLRHIAGGLLVFFQVTLILSGNLSFLNWLTIVAYLGCFDDSLLRRVLPARLVAASERAQAAARPSRAQAWVVAGYALLVAVLSIAPIRNLIGSSQIMNTSFDRLNLVNTYGAFGSVGQVRNEIILQGTRAEVIDAATVWKEYEWKCKPSDPLRRPCLITPYHYRLDWLIWFAAMSDYHRYPWVTHVVWKLLHNDPGVLSLLANDPFPGEPPRYIRAELYRYEFTRLGEKSDAWWKRRRVGSYLPPLSADNNNFKTFLRAYGWVE